MFLAWKELRFYKLKYGLIIGITVLLTFMVLFLGGLANGLSNATSATIKGNAANYYIVAADSDQIINRSEISADEYAVLKTNFQEATAFNILRTSIRTLEDATKIDCTYLAVDTNSFIVSTIDGASSLKDNEILLNVSFEDEGIAVGDVIKDAATDTELTVIGFTKNQSYAHSPVGVMTLATYQSIRSEMLHIDIIPYNAIAIKDTKISSNVLNDDNFNLLSKNEIISKIPGHSQEQMSINMILWVLLVISAAILGVFFFVITIQKLPLFGTLKAVGTPMSKLAGMIISQVLLIAGGSIIIGDILTFSLSAMMPSKMPFSLGVNEALLVSGAFVLISVISSLFTLIKVSKVDPLIAIGGNE